jgi:PEP-CTERM motif
MTRLASTIAAVVLAASTATAGAADFTFSGNITYNTDVIRIGFHLDNDATNVKVWTDSFMNGINFDPITAVWNMTAGGTLIDTNDDQDDVAPGQTYYDSGFVIPSLAAGDYLFTVAAYPNDNVGSNLSQGFDFDGTTPVAISEWCQPAAHNCGDPTLNQKGTFYRVHLSGVDDATPPPVTPAVPEPQTYALMLAGLGLMSYVARRRR